MTLAWLAALTLVCAGVIVLLVWDRHCAGERWERARLNGRPLTAAEEYAWAVITARLIEETQRD